MIVYLIKSTTILAIVISVYHLFLEKEKMHSFNRFYLLSGIFLSFIIPVITVSHVEITQTISEFVLTDIPSTIIPAAAVISESAIDWNSILMFGYLGITAILLFRFLYNLGTLLLRAWENEQIRHRDFTLVLLEENIIPHSFFNYIYLNKIEYQNEQIEDEIFTHELTHADQLHSLDIILIEFLQIFFWFNPVIFFYKKAIQLNHEYLADEQVIQYHPSIKDYQHLLVDKAIISNTVHLASNLNFSVTKKRLEMMTKTTAQWRSTLYALLTLPLFVGLLLLFGNEAIAQTSSAQETSEMQAFKDKHFHNATVVYIQKDGSKIYKPYKDLTAAEKSRLPIPPPPPPATEGETLSIEPLPKGSIIEIDSDNNIRVRSNGEYMLPKPPKAPKPPKEPKAPKAVKAPKASKIPLPPAPPVPPEVNEPAPPPPAPSEMIAPVAPPPPPPLAPKDYIAKMAKSGASFMLNGKSISKEEALEYVNKSDGKLSLRSESNGGKTVVYIK